MTYLVSKIILIFIGVCILLNASMMVLGNSQPPQAALAGFSEGCDHKPQPCWYGITPGITHEHELLQQMTFAGEARYSYDDLGSSYIIYFTLPDTNPACIFTFRLVQGVVVKADVSLCRKSSLRLGDIALLSTTAPYTVSLAPHDVVYGAVSVNVEGWPAPTSSVSFINFLSRPDRLQQYEWHGFVPLWRYCQFEPEYPQCR